MSKLTKAAKPTPFHHMLATLAQQDRLLRLYSQNVDGIDTALEPLATKIPLKKTEGKWPKTVQLHGGLDKMVCSKCHELSDFNPDLFHGPVPPVCLVCEDLNRVRTEVAGKRSHGVGMLRPRMVLYNEHNPDDEAIGSVTREDLRKRPDAVIVVGTTLKVPGVKRIVREMCATVRNRRDGVAIWINNDPEPSGKEFEDCWDIVVRGTCDQIATSAAMRQWDQSDQPLDVSDEEGHMSQKSDVEVVIQNLTFKRPRDDATPMCSPRRPVATPMTSHRSSEEPFIKDSFGTDLEDLAPPTPSKKPKISSAFGKIMDTKKETKPKATVKNARKAPTKASVTKPKAAPKKAAAKKAPAKPQPRITQTLKQTKSIVSATEKANKKAAPRSPAKRAVTLNPIPSVDARNNLSPTNADPNEQKGMKVENEDDSEMGDVVHVANPIAT